MVIQHNIMSINSHRQMGINNKNLSGNLEKLSSGYRINRAADDAAGLAISEKMRAQITGLERASLNAQDGASLIQTAEGALTEVHSMLNRMVELSTQSANGTIQAEDRGKIEQEVTHLKGEIDRISKSTNFNGINLLDGTLGDGTSAIDLANSLFAPGNTIGGALAGVVTNISGVSLEPGAEFTIGELSSDSVNGYVGDGTDLDQWVEVSITKENGDIVKTALKLEDIVSFKNPDGSKAGMGDTPAVGAQGSIDLSSVGLGKMEFTVTTSAVADKANLQDLLKMATSQKIIAGDPATGNGLVMQVGDTSANYNKITVSVDDMSTTGLGIDTISMTTQSNASAALDKIKAAIEKVSTNRGELGALQNRLDHTINNLGVATENMTASESRIRDVDMAKEMMAFTKNNVLAQAAQSMLAQANQQPQQVLQLLR